MRSGWKLLHGCRTKEGSSVSVCLSLTVRLSLLRNAQPKQRMECLIVLQLQLNQRETTLNAVAQRSEGGKAEKGEQEGLKVPALADRVEAR